MVGVYRPDSGEVTVDGVQVYENPRLKARIGYIPDDIFYFPAATLEEMKQFYSGLIPILTVSCSPGSMRFLTFPGKARCAGSPRACRSRQPSS